jgi:hypothetical protein
VLTRSDPGIALEPQPLSMPLSTHEVVGIMRCPQCGSETPDDEWNCVSCRMNLYWASQHYDDLAVARRTQGMPRAETPSFLVEVHQRAMNERAERGGRVEHKVRQIARRAMQRRA